MEDLLHFMFLVYTLSLFSLASEKLWIAPFSSSVPDIWLGVN